MPCLKEEEIRPKGPPSFHEACRFSEWRAAIDRKYDALVSRETWSYFKLQPGIKSVPFTWVFKIKPLDAEGN